MTPLAAAGDGIRTALQRTADADRLLQALLDPLPSKQSGMAILATGGYGRGDLSPYSDLDLIILINGDPEQHDPAIRGLVQGLWDSGLHPGQTVLHIDDIDDKLLAIPDRAATLLETRTLWGDEELIGEFSLCLNTRFDESAWSTFVSVKHEEFLARREKFGDVTRVVEPHLKAQAGGLRDMHHVLWLERARTALEGKWSIRRSLGSEIQSFLGRLHDADLLNRDEWTRLVDSYDLLLRLREALRKLKKSDEDKLLVQDQPAVAQTLGYRGSDREVMRDLMRGVYESNERIARFSVEFGALLAEFGVSRRPLSTPIPGLPGAQRSRGRIDLDDEALATASSSPEHLVALVDATIQHGLPLSGRTRHALRRRIREQEGAIHDPAAWSAPLREWLHLEEGFAKRLRVLDELDAMSLWLPEWMEIVGLTTGSYYHSYTVDEHTLLALEKLDQLPPDGPEGLPQSLWADLGDQPLVYLSLIFHDIAKGREEGEHHSIIGAQLVVAALERLGWDEWAEAVARLVEIHLKMEQVAFRRDIKDPDVIEQFAGMVGDEALLRVLYLLTVCDLSAVSPRVWTAWKGRLLAELYLETRDWFQRGAKPADSTVAHELERVAPLIEDSDTSQDQVRDFLASMREEYRRAVPPDEIAVHVRAAAGLRAGRPFHWQIDTHQGYIVLTLVTWDRPGLLAQVTGLLVTQGIGIREARIFTRKDGIIVDRFRAEDIETRGVPLEERLARIEELWGQLSEGEIAIEELFARFQRRRRFDRTPPAALIEAEISVTPAPTGVLVDVSGPDSVGLLHRLCSIFANEGLDVHAARVSRRLDGVMDNFVLHDPSGKLETDADREELVKRLREAIDAAA